MENEDNGKTDELPGENNVLPFPEEPGSARRWFRKSRTPLSGDAPEEGEDGRDAEGVRIVLKKIIAQAAHGMTREEILVLLGEAIAEEGITEEEFQAVVERGIIEGCAEIKRAQYQAALRGKVNAQAKVLSLLGAEEGPEPEDKGETQEFEVIREIIPEAPEEGR